MMYRQYKMDCRYQGDLGLILFYSDAKWRFADHHLDKQRKNPGDNSGLIYNAPDFFVRDHRYHRCVVLLPGNMFPVAPLAKVSHMTHSMFPVAPLAKVSHMTHSMFSVAPLAKVSHMTHSQYAVTWVIHSMDRGEYCNRQCKRRSTI